MFKWLKMCKLKRIRRELDYLRVVNEDNWPKYRALFIEWLLLTCEVEMNCTRDMAYWNALASFRRNQDTLAANMPAERIADLFVTLRELSHAHNRGLHDRIEEYYENSGKRA